MEAFSVGTTGTRKAITIYQIKMIEKILSNIRYVYKSHIPVLRHGDCVGSDKSVHAIAILLGYCTISHPPLNGVLRAYTKNTYTLPAKSYLDRDRDIVDLSNIILATPNSYNSQPRSGTWYTINYALSVDKPLLVVYPDGSVKRSTNYANYINTLTGIGE